MRERVKRNRPAPRRERLLTGIGENGMIARLGALLPAPPHWVRAGAGADDAAILDLGPGPLWLFTCDVQSEGTHFERRWIDAFTLGQRAAAVNLSDIAAMGGTPRLALVSLLLPPRLPARFFDAVMRGLAARFTAARTIIVGGNLARAAHIAIDVTVAGQVRRDRVVRRRGARPGDLLVVSGDPGASAAGLALLRTGAAPSALTRRFLLPEPRLEVGRFLAAAGATAMLDVSDGVSTDVQHLCDASAVGVEIEWEKLPVSSGLARAGRTLEREPRAWALHGGEAYELLCTIPPSRAAALRRGSARLGIPLHVIGRVLPRHAGRWLVRAGKRRPLARQGFAHFGANHDS